MHFACITISDVYGENGINAEGAIIDDPTSLGC